MTILVTYATKAGSTAEVAAHIGDTLRQCGLTVDVRPVNEVDSLVQYDGVVVGSAIRIGHVLPEIAEFVRLHRAGLSQIPTAYFVVCMTLSEDTAENRKAVSDYLTPLREMVTPVSEGLFAGKVDRQKIEQPWCFLTRFVKDGPMAGGDWRDWDEISSWATGIAPLLRSQNFQPVS